MAKSQIQITIDLDTGIEEVRIEGEDFKTHREALDFMNDIENALESFDERIYQIVEKRKKVVTPWRAILLAESGDHNQQNGI